MSWRRWCTALDSAEFLLGTVTAVSQTNGIRIQLDGQDAAMSKYYKMLNTGADAPGTGDRVVVMKHSGTYIVMGRIGMPNQDSGKVSRSGDTMTGILRMADSDLAIDDPNITLGTKPASTQLTHRFRFRDSLQQSFARILGAYTPAGQAGLQLYADNYVDGQNVYNYLGMYMGETGIASVAMSHPAAWRWALGLGTNGALPITVAQGGTGAATVAANRVFAGPSSGNAAAPSFRALAASDLPTVPISKGGTGQSGVTVVTDPTEIFVMAPGFSCNWATYAAWGKIAMVTASFHVVQAVTTSSWTTWATIVAGKRPLAAVVGNITRTSYCTVGSDGVIDVSSTVSADANYIFTAVYLLP